MDWLISIFITLGIGLFMYGLTSPIISPEIAKLSGLILILIGIWLAIRYNVSEFVFPFLLKVEARFWG